MCKPFTRHLIDLCEDHPFEIGLSLALVLFGIRTFITGLQAAPGSVQALPLGLAVAYCSLSVLGGASVLFGLITRYKFRWAYGAERLGLFISASAWGAYTVGLCFAPITSRSTLVILALAALSLASLLRARAIQRNAKATLFALRQAQADRKEA